MYDTSFTITFPDIYMFLKGHVSQHQERSCKDDLSITSRITLFSKLLVPLRSMVVQCMDLWSPHKMAEIRLSAWQ